MLELVGVVGCCTGTPAQERTQRPVAWVPFHWWVDRESPTDQEHVGQEGGFHLQADSDWFVLLRRILKLC